MPSNRTAAFFSAFHASLRAVGSRGGMPYPARKPAPAVPPVQPAAASPLPTAKYSIRTLQRQSEARRHPM
jgi:hypothetical protein